MDPFLDLYNSPSSMTIYKKEYEWDSRRSMNDHLQEGVWFQEDSTLFINKVLVGTFLASQILKDVTNRMFMRRMFMRRISMRRISMRRMSTRRMSWEGYVWEGYLWEGCLNPRNTRTQLTGLTPVASHVDIFFSPFPIFENIQSEKWCDISEVLLTAIRKNCVPSS